jgi:enoyl-CoA hydratase
VSAQQAADWGFVNRVVAPDQLMAEARALAGEMLQAQGDMLTRYKSVINDGFALPFGQGMPNEPARSRGYKRQVGAQEIEQRRESVRRSNRERG